jgi:hypothetical protein
VAGVAWNDVIVGAMVGAEPPHAESATTASKSRILRHVMEVFSSDRGRPRATARPAEPGQQMV